MPKTQKEVLCVSKNKTAKEKRPWLILIWLILYLVNPVSYTHLAALQPFVKLFANILYANSTDIYYI